MTIFKVMALLSLACMVLICQILLPIVGGTSTAGAPQAPVIISTSPLPPAAINSPYSFNFVATGTGPITWSATGVPAGLSFSASGLLSGTPTSTGTFTINVTAMNSIGSAGPTAFSLTVNAQSVFTAATCNVSDVNAVINGPIHTAVDGDTIQIPVGSCTWASGIVVPPSLGISITGVGTPTADPAVMGPDPTCSQTVITLAVPATSTVAFRESPSFGNSTSRISCMAINYSSGVATGIGVLGACTPAGCPNIRWDNLSFNNWAGHTISAANAYGINLVTNVFGVIDHNSVIGTPITGGFLNLVHFNHASYLGVGSYGDNSWAQPPHFGTSNAIFLENNFLVNTGATENEGTLFGFTNQGGGRITARFSQYNSMGAQQSILTWHGTESGGRPRSTRSFELYGNTYQCGDASTSVFCAFTVNNRGGNGYEWGNIYTQFASGRIGSIIQLGPFRIVGNPGGWGACDGTAPWDVNDGVNPDGTGTPTIYFSGNITAITGVNPPPFIQPYIVTIVDTAGVSPTWTPGQWTPVGVNLGAPYSIHDVTQTTNPLNPSGNEIIDNTADTLTLRNTQGAAGQYVPVVGDAIQITRAPACMDQSDGRGAGRLFNSTNPMTPALPANQILEPAYRWMLTVSPGTAQRNVSSFSARFLAGREYYTESVNQAAQTSPTSPFDGTNTLGAEGGVGHGTLANRPATCDPTTAYWATDQGNWNTSGNGFGQGQLYTCTAPNVWTLTYTPFTYPHPLIH